MYMSTEKWTFPILIQLARKVNQNFQQTTRTVSIDLPVTQDSALNILNMNAHDQGQSTYTETKDYKVW